MHGYTVLAYFLVEKVAKKHFPEGNSPFGGRSAPIKGPPVKSRDGFFLRLLRDIAEDLPIIVDFVKIIVILCPNLPPIFTVSFC